MEYSSVSFLSAALLAAVLTGAAQAQSPPPNEPVQGLSQAPLTTLIPLPDQAQARLSTSVQSQVPLRFSGTSVSSLMVAPAENTRAEVAPPSKDRQVAPSDGRLHPMMEAALEQILAAHPKAANHE